MNETKSSSCIHMKRMNKGCKEVIHIKVNIKFFKTMEIHSISLVNKVE